MAAPTPSQAPLGDAPPAVKPKVIYVMGTGRCGSTILGVTLGNCENVVFAGELEKWLPTSGTPVLGGAERTRFWNEVRAEVKAPADAFGSEARDTLERDRAAFRVHKWPRRAVLRRRYRPVTADLYRAIARVANVTHIVDTSHLPLRARELRGIDGIDVYLLLLVRDPQSVLASLTSGINDRDVARRRLRALAANADLCLTHLLSMFVFLGHRPDRRLFVHYEDFVSDPEGVLRQVLDLADSRAPIPDLTSLKTGSPICGNRLLRSDVVSLKRGAPAPPARRSLMTAAAQTPMAALLSRLRPVAASSPRGPRAAR